MKYHDNRMHESINFEAHGTYRVYLIGSSLIDVVLDSSDEIARKIRTVMSVFRTWIQRNYLFIPRTPPAIKPSNSALVIIPHNIESGLFPMIFVEKRCIMNSAKF